MPHSDRETADRLAIIEVINRYGAAIDAGDWARLQTCFTEQAVVDFGGRRLEGPAAIARFIEETTVGVRWQQHLLGSHDLAVGGDSATASTQLIATQVSRDNPEEVLITIGTYRDTLVRTASGWRISERTLQVGWRETRVRQRAAGRT